MSGSEGEQCGNPPFLCILDPKHFVRAPDGPPVKKDIHFCGCLFLTRRSIIRGEEPDGRDRRETVRWTVEQGAFEAGLNEAGERDPTRAKGEAAGSP